MISCDELVLQLMAQQLLWLSCVMPPMWHLRSSQMLCCSTSCNNLRIQNAPICVNHCFATCCPAAFLDNMTYTFIQLASSALENTSTITRQRNLGEASATLQSLRPDFMLHVGAALLFKGEEKAQAKDLTAAIYGLIEKMKGWSAVYHGLVS